MQKPLQLTTMDLARFRLLDQSANPDAWSDTLLAAALADSNSEVWAYAESGSLNGVVVLARLPFDVEIQSITVASHARRQGIGTALIYWVVERAKHHAAERVLLEVRAENQAAIALYHACGFVQDGVRRGYYRNADGSGEDAVLMSLSLSGRKH